MKIVSSKLKIGLGRAAFTLIEMLVVITILMVLAVTAAAVFKANSGSDRTRSAARIAQSAFLGAKDRALHAKEPRGVRLIRDLNDPTIVTGFTYLAPIADRQYGLSVSNNANSIQVLRPDANNDGQGVDATTPEAILVAGTNVDWLTLDTNGFFAYPTTRIRIPAGTGAWYSLVAIPGNTSPPYYAQTRGNTVLLTLASPLENPESSFPNVVAVDSTSSQASCEIELANNLLSFHQPISLPSAVVIDLDQSSPNVNNLWPATPTAANIDIMFSPRGMIVGPLAALGPIHFLLNGLTDATRNLNPIDPANQGDKLVLTIFPQTGLVATFPIDPVDVVNNQTGAQGADGLADDLFHFAKVGSSAGQ